MFRRSGARYAATVLLSYFLSLSMMLLITGVILLRTAMSPWYIVRHFEQSGFAEYAREDLAEIFISHGLASGVPSEVMEPLITAKHITDAAEGCVMAAFGVSGRYAFDNYSDEVFTAICKYAEAQGIELTEDVEAGIRSLADLCANALRDYVDSPIFGALARVQSFDSYIFMAVAASAIMAAISIFLIPFVNKRVTRWIDGYLYALGAASAMCAAIPIAASSLGFATRLQISPLSYNRFIASWLGGIINGYLVALIPLVALIIVCIIVRVWRWKRRERIRS